MANPTYRAPGTAADPWGPYIREASQHSSVPESWVRAVMHQESGGHEYLDGQPITSSSGAMGLMQLMPQTYADMQDRLNLGSDPYDPHDNIAAGTEYIAILSRKYGSPAFLAAYNAGPQRLEAYLNQSRPLPHETVAYIAAISPHLSDAPPAATDIATTTPQNSSSISAAWAKRAYTPVPPTQTDTANLPAPVSTVQCDPNAAYDTTDNCTTPTTILAPPTPTLSNTTSNSFPNATEPTPPPPVQPHSTQQPPTAAVSHYGAWSIQVGAFNSVGQARFAATMARQAAFSTLQSTQTTVQAININGRTLWRSRLSGLDAHSAATACHQLSAQNLACIPKEPGQ
nr:transglycosylase SLT domain-containing protein [uncultured Neokomagataea sp.]